MTLDKYEIAATAYPNEILEPFDNYYQLAGFKALCHLVDEFGGTALYIPKTKAIFKNCLINVIKEEYDGKNIKKLAHKYDYSVNGLRNLLSGSV